MNRQRNRSVLMVAAVALCLASVDALHAEDEGPTAIDTSLFVVKGKPGPGLHHEIVVKGTRDQIFDKWTTSEGIKSFLGADSNVELRIGGPMEWYFLPPEHEGKRGSEGCQFLSYLPGKMISFSWNAPPSLPVEREKRTWIVVTLHDEAEGSTRVVVDHIGFGEGGKWKDVHAYFDKAWPNVLKALQSSCVPKDENEK